MQIRVVFTAINGKVQQHDYPHWLDAYERINSIRNIYACMGYRSEYGDDHQMKRDELEVWEKPNCPNLFINHYRIMED